MNYSIDCYLNNYGLCIKKLFNKNNIKNNINNDLLNKIREHLTVKPIANMGSELESYEIFYEDENYIVLPKFLTSIKTSDGEFINFNIKKYKFTHKTINITFKGNLRDYQNNIILNVMDLFKNAVNKSRANIPTQIIGNISSKFNDPFWLDKKFEAFPFNELEIKTIMIITILFLFGF